jgi:hypothetical protein
MKLHDIMGNELEGICKERVWPDRGSWRLPEMIQKSHEKSQLK